MNRHGLGKALALALACALVGCFALQGDAAAAQKKKAHAKHHRLAKVYTPRAEAERKFDPDAYHEFDANKLPFGSSAWWQQMTREGRAGGGNP
jgi:hypothetical protein